MHQHSKEKKVLHATAKQGEKVFTCTSIARRKSFYMQQHSKEKFFYMHQHSKEKEVLIFNYYWHCTDNWCCAKRFTVVINANAR